MFLIPVQQKQNMYEENQCTFFCIVSKKAFHNHKQTIAHLLILLKFPFWNVWIV